ncbi:uncharacterized protein BP5553_04212 [Venustampulla echinocandica]|uniref:Uncharacterized protein n=1 Tax=Venustampulla echinocandica TaxID=2656787 RepID=A0A370TWG5_9HELO|nr:uncharacterized protein BP5553_04212 [Venustampulla echinocandica]RDL39872.1 hypothetical protein BP5553_04212 [Venustampulla echinocandica]
MPPCNTCVRSARGYGQMSLVKRQPGSNVRLIVDTPGYVAEVPQKALHAHLPKLFHDARQAGNRVVRPLDYFTQTFQNIKDENLHSDALNWVFTRIERYTNYPHQTFPFNAPDPDNTFQILFQYTEEAYNSDDPALSLLIENAMEQFTAVSNVLRKDRGLSHSRQLLREYIETARYFLPYVADQGPMYTFDLLEAVYNASTHNMGAMQRLVQSLGLQERDELARVTFSEAQNGDIMALRLLPLL